MLWGHALEAFMFLAQSRVLGVSLQMFILFLSGCTLNLPKTSEPVVQILSPENGAVFTTADMIPFDGMVVGSDVVQVTWMFRDQNAYAQVEAVTPTSMGEVVFSTALPEGEFTITLGAEAADNTHTEVQIFINVEALDSDGDGVPDTEDCAPEDALYSVDQSWFYDGDGDGFGDPSAFAEACVPAADFVLDPTDCDDGRADVSPGAVEICDGVDNNCDMQVDEGLIADFWWDGDADGFGDAQVPLSACVAPVGYVENSEDCDDFQPNSYPGASEVCDGLDNNCDGGVDEAAVDAPTWYFDGDSDGFGDATVAWVVVCVGPVGYALGAGDCNDGDPLYYPYAAESCGDPDYNCDGLAGFPVLYADSDGDGHGDPNVTVYSTDPCAPGAGGVLVPDDCDDTVSTTYLGAVELCDGVDNNCEGRVDEDDPRRGATFYVDVDGDGYGNVWITACTSPGWGYVTLGGDCNDAERAISPAAVEVCDALDIDENCNLLADDLDSSVDVATFQDWYQDRDADGFGDINALFEACDAPLQTVADASDCDDGRVDVNPQAQEWCDALNVDEDCDGLADDMDGSASGQSVWYEDGDGDLYGGVNSQQSCDAAPGFVSMMGDCDDVLASVNPGQVSDTCDGHDSDCDTLEDEDAVPDSYDLSAPNGSWALASALGYGSRTLSNLTLTQSDYNGATGYYEDWYSFYGDDDSRKNVNMNVSVMGGPGIIAELYNDIRPNTLIPGLSFQGRKDTFGEGNFHLRIYNTRYQSYQCNIPYSITITFN